MRGRHAMSRATVIALAVLAAAASLAVASPAAAASKQWEHYIYAPASRTIVPDWPAKKRLQGNGASVTIDFGKEVGGLVSLHFAGSSDPTQQVGLAFSESSQGIGPASDASNGGPQADGAIYANATGPGTYTMPAAKLRGGFRYLTLFLNSSGWVDIDRVSLRFTAAPAMSDPRAYPNYFYSSDDLLNRIWYAGAYTVQMDTIAPDQGRVWPPPPTGWDNSANVGVGRSVLVDGAKRDRTAWPGDLGISVPTDYAAFFDLPTIRDSLTTLYQHQDPEGALPYAGPAVNFPGALSDTYHLWTLIATADYFQYSGDKAWLDSVWSKYQSGVSWSASRIDQNGLLYVTGSGDWARSGQGGENIAANVLLQHVLATGSALARAEGDEALATQYSDQAAALRSTINQKLWDATAGAYQDNPSSTVHPQDGNSLAVWFGIPDTAGKNSSILANLRRNWVARGAHTPEWTGIHPYPGSLEVLARLAGGDDTGALDLIRREWGYMLNAPIGTGSTYWEGFNDDGSFAYESTGHGYTSLAHGWATGPTSALTFFVLGLAPEDAPAAYRFVPHPGDLKFARGRLTLPQGALTASWRRTASGFAMHLTSPRNTHGRIGVPVAGPSTLVKVNGAPARGRRDGGYLYLDGVPGGTYDITSGPARSRTCRARRVVLTIRIRRGLRAGNARATVGRRRVKARVIGRRVVVRFVLPARRGKLVRVRVAIHFASGRVRHVTRSYRACA
jgi:hypothetical protein